MARRIKDWLKAYLEYTSLSESPEIFHFWTGVSTLAGALRRRVWISQRYFEWTPNFYIVFVAPPGVAAKSTTIRNGIALLREVEGVSFGPDSGTWQAIGKALVEAKELVAVDAHSLDGELSEMSCITCAVGELGTFLDFQDRKLVDVLTALWDGQRETFEHSTSTQGKILINNPWINIIAATTPAWLKKNVPEESIGGGFASRVIFVFGSKKRQLVAYPGLVGDKAEFEGLKRDLIHDLREIAESFGEVELTPDAIDFGQQWYEKHWTERPIHMASERFDGYIARKQTHMHKLAMVLAASEGNPLVVERSHLMKAEKITTAMENDMINVFESIGVAPTSQKMGELFSFIKTYQDKGHAVHRQMLWRHAMQIMSAQEFQEAVDAAVSAGYLKVAANAEGTWYTLNLDEINGQKASAQSRPH